MTYFRFNRMSPSAALGAVLTVLIVAAVNAAPTEQTPGASTLPAKPVLPHSTDASWFVAKMKTIVDQGQLFDPEQVATTLALGANVNPGRKSWLAGVRSSSPLDAEFTPAVPPRGGDGRQPPARRHCFLKVNLQLRTPSRLPEPVAASNLAATRNEMGVCGGANLMLWSESAEIPCATSVAVPSGLI